MLVKTKEMEKILYIDMDNALVDFPSGVSKLSQEVIKEYESNLMKYSQHRNQVNGPSSSRASGIEPGICISIAPETNHNFLIALITCCTSPKHSFQMIRIPVIFLLKL